MSNDFQHKEERNQDCITFSKASYSQCASKRYPPLWGSLGYGCIVQTIVYS